VQDVERGTEAWAQFLGKLERFEHPGFWNYSPRDLPAAILKVIRGNPAPRNAA